MAVSIDITGLPKLTDAEFAKLYGVSLKRQRAIKKIVQDVARQMQSEKARKAAAKGSPVRRKAA